MSHRIQQTNPNMFICSSVCVCVCVCVCVQIILLVVLIVSWIHNRKRLRDIKLLGIPYRQSYYLKIKQKNEITLGNNFLLFECFLDFYNWFRVFFHCWIRKWHPFLSIRSGFWAFEKNQIFWQNRLHFCGIISWFLSTHIIRNMFLREKYFANNIYWLPDKNIDYFKLNGGDW